MSARTRSSTLLCALALCLGANCIGAGCSSRTHSSAAQVQREREAETLVTGTVLDAATGEPLSGVKVVGPHDTRATSGRDGRFELRGLRVRDQGTISARTGDGRKAQIELRALTGGTLDVVLHLHAP